MCTNCAGMCLPASDCAYMPCGRSKLSCTIGCPSCRLISALQLLALVVFCIAYPTVLDYVAFLFDCQWTNISNGHPPYHILFTDHSKAVGQAGLFKSIDLIRCLTQTQYNWHSCLPVWHNDLPAWMQNNQAPAWMQNDQAQAHAQAHAVLAAILLSCCIMLLCRLYSNAPPCPHDVCWRDHPPSCWHGGAHGQCHA